MAIPLSERPDEELERDLIDGKLGPRKRVIAEAVLRRRYIAKGWVGRLRLMWLRFFGLSR